MSIAGTIPEDLNPFSPPETISEKYTAGLASFSVRIPLARHVMITNALAVNEKDMSSVCTCVSDASVNTNIL